MNHDNARLSEIEAQISSAIARIILRLLPKLPRTEWRNRIIPFPATYKKVGYVMKLDRGTTRKILMLLSLKNTIKLVNFHGVILDEEIPVERSILGAHLQNARVPLNTHL